MKHRRPHAFTLIELLVVVAVIAVLAGIALPIYGNVQTSAKRTQSLSNMRQFGVMTISYAADNNGVYPTQGSSAPTWAANAPKDVTAWYNVLPHNYGNGKGVSDYANSPAEFYKKGSMFYVPAAVYPSTKLAGPCFAFTFCSKLSGTVNSQKIEESSVRLSNFQAPAETCLFQESGLPGEKPIRTSQSAYSNQPYTFASRAVARYGDKTIIVFADGHAEAIAGTDVVDPSGKAYYPQSGGKTFWTMDPTLNANL